MKGYTGRLLRVNLSDSKVSKEEISEDMKRDFLGGRGFAIKLLWHEVRNVDPLSEDNKIIFSTGPLTGQLFPSSGKMVIASKSPLTGGYGDGNIGSLASSHLKRSGYDVLVVEGRSEKPCYLFIEDENVAIVVAPDLWGKSTFEAQDILEAKHGKNIGILLIGPGGENKVPFANVISQKGRAGGRPGMGAVMGSKNLKAVVVKGSRNVPNFDDAALKEIGKKGYDEIKGKDCYDFWTRHGTMQMVEWCEENACLPVHNFKEGVYEHSKELDGYMLEKLKVDRKGCPMCNMQCGNIILDADKMSSELDYENVAMLGPNIGMKDLRQVAVLNRMADEWGLDSITLGSCIGFAMEASEKGLIPERIGWGDFGGTKTLIEAIGEKKGLGEILGQGISRSAEFIGRDSQRWAMHVKGLGTSGYNCHACPGMALSFGTSPIGASHKDAWVIAWEVSTDRFSYSRDKVQKVIDLQRIRGGFFESATVCRLPWVDVNLGFNLYEEYMEMLSGNHFSMEDFYKLGDRIYNLMRAYWIRENRKIDRQWDYPPSRWFEEPQSRGKLKGITLDKDKFDQMLSWYYELRGWDQNGIPLKQTLDNLGLEEVSRELMG
jgi:aldehyde:ferredoxin oxidoreductase